MIVYSKDKTFEKSVYAELCFFYDALIQKYMNTCMYST